MLSRPSARIRSRSRSRGTGQMRAEVIDGRGLAKLVIDGVREQLPQLPRPPGLAVVLAGDDPASHIYVKNKAKLALELGFLAEVHLLPGNASEVELLTEIAALNARDEIDGILVQLPLPEGINTLRVMVAIDPAKDVDGLHALNAGRLSQGSGVLIPCTPLGCLRIIKSVVPDLQA